MKAPTERQAQILGLLVEHLLQMHGTAPIRWLCARTGIRSTNGMKEHLAALQRKGYILREPFACAVTILHHADGRLFTLRAD